MSSVSCQLCAGKKEIYIGADEIRCPLCRKSKDKLVVIDTEQMDVIDTLCSAFLMSMEKQNYNMANILAHIIDCLPEYDVLAIMLCEIYDVPDKYIEKIRRAFNFHKRFE